MIRPLLCVLLVGIIGFTRIALGDLDQDVNKAQKQLHAVLRDAVYDLVKKGERDAQTIEKLSLERTQTEQANYIAAYTVQQVRRGVRRSDAEFDAKETISRMVGERVNSQLGRSGR